eukprot:UN02371
MYIGCTLPPKVKTYSNLEGSDFDQLLQNQL